MRKIKVKLLDTKSRADLIDYVNVHNKGYLTEPWFGILQDAVSLEDAQKMDYDATFLAEIENEKVGLIDVKVREKRAYIENLVVLKAFRCKGIGTDLLMAAESFALKKGLKTIFAETPVEAESANIFYKKAGYSVETRAYLIKTNEPLKLESCTHVSVYKVKNGIYWIPTERDFVLIKQQKSGIKIIGIFNVYKKEF
jgi:ribosomal protein S18 acetylase RimI-like enzyme